MPHDTAFAAAALPTRFFILGLPMKPYSIGHEMILLAQKNPLVYVGFEQLPEDQQRGAILKAALICSQGWIQNHKPHRNLRLWHLLSVRGADFKSEIAKFQKYRAEGSAFPPAPDKEAEMIAGDMAGEQRRTGRELGSPYLTRLYNFICNLPYAEIRLHGETAFDFPFSLGSWLYLTHLEFDGDVKIENSKEAEIKAEMDGHRAAFAKEKTCPLS